MVKNQIDKKSMSKNKYLNNIRISNQLLKKEVFTYYCGGIPHCMCQKCVVNDINMLTIGHIKNDGAEHRKKIRGGIATYHWLKKNGYPKDYQVECFNCNSGKRKENECPHLKEEVK